MMVGKHRLYVVIGNVGSGKSTFTQKLSKSLRATPVMADELFKKNPFFKKAVKDRKKWSFKSDLWFLHERHTFMKKVEKKLVKQSVIVDSGIYMSYAYGVSKYKMGYFDKSEFDLFLKIATQYMSEIRRPDAVIYLKAPTAILLQRIRLRGRGFEKIYSSNYLDSLRFGLQKLNIFFKKQKIPVYTFSGPKKTIKEVLEEITDKLHV